MHEKLKKKMGIECANCKSCIHLGTEGDGYEYNGTWEICTQFDSYCNLTSFPFKKDMKCWEPLFWVSKFVGLISPDGDQDKAIAEFNKAFAEVSA